MHPTSSACPSRLEPHVEESSQDPCPRCTFSFTKSILWGPRATLYIPPRHYPPSPRWTHVCSSVATLTSPCYFSGDIKVEPRGRSLGRFHWRYGPQAGRSPIQLQGLSFVLDFRPSIFLVCILIPLWWATRGDHPSCGRPFL